MKRLAALFIATRLYLLAVPCALLYTGAAMNQAVLVANGGKFPVMLNEKASAKYADGYLDGTHYVMSADTKLNWLADFVDLQIVIKSPGDLLIDLAMLVRSGCYTAWVVLLLGDVTRLRK